MKFRIKIKHKYTIYFALALLLLGSTVFFMRHRPATALPHKESLEILPPQKKTEKRQPIKLERYSSYLENTSNFDKNVSSDTLAAMLNDCAIKIFKSVLPEKSALQMPLDIDLTDESAARVSGKAVLFADGSKKEQILQCKVKINFLANGSCQAEYPEFVVIK